MMTPMTDQNAFNELKEYVNNLSSDLALNGELLDILDGNLKYYVDRLLREQLSPQAYSEARHRVCPINLLKKINDKLAAIYSPGPIRTLENGNEKDQAMFHWYLENSNFNKAMNAATEKYSLCKSTLIEPLIHKSKLFIRVRENDRFVVKSDDPINHLSPTMVIVPERGVDGGSFLVWTDDYVVRYHESGTIDYEYMEKIENPECVNIYGQLPFVYANSSNRQLMPCADVDMKTMVTLLPLLFSDLNYAVMFQCFSIVYGINIDDADLKRAPNAFWNIKVDAGTDNKPEIGTIKPQVDIDQVLGLIQSELSLFLNSRGIKPGSIGSLNKDTFASGISKMVDEIDTVELRKELVTEFVDVEFDLWQFILHVGHPIWRRDINNNLPPELNADFSDDCFVAVKFPEQLPLQNRGQVVKDLKEEVDAKFTTRKRAIQMLNPGMTAQEIDELIEEIEKENSSGNEVAEDRSIDPQGPDTEPTGPFGGAIYRSGEAEDGEGDRQVG